MTSFFLGYNIATGAGLSFNSATNVLSNSGVLSLQGDTGSLSLVAGTGISISGLTISNAGIVSASAGNGISVSGSNPLTITNTGVLSLQGDTGALSLVAGTGIGISGLTITNDGIVSASAGDGITVSGTNPLTIAMSGSYSGSFAISGTLEITNGTSADGNDISVNFPVTLTASSGGEYFSILSSINGGEIFNLYGKYSTNSSSNLSDAFVAIYDYRLSSDLLHLDLFSGSMGSYKNTLDDGSGNMTIAGAFTINGNVSTTAATYLDTVEFAVNASDRFYLQIYASEGKTSSTDGDFWLVGWAATGQHLLSVHGSGDVNIAGVLNTGGSVIIAENSTGAFSGYDNTGNIRYWLGYQDGGSNDLYLRNPASSSNLYLGATVGIYTGNASVPPTIRNTLDDGSGNMSVAGGLSVSDTTVLGHSGGNNGVTIYAYAPDNVLGRFGTFNLKGEGGLFISSAADNGLDYGFFMVEDQNSGQFGFYNLGSTTYNGLGGSKYTISLLTSPNGLLQTMANQNTSLGSAIGLTARNILDDGSGNMNVAGVITSGNITVYTSGSGTYNTPSGAHLLRVVMCAGGGAGSGGSSAGDGGSGGGGGESGIYYIYSPASSYSYTVGAGGAVGAAGSGGGNGSATTFNGLSVNGGEGAPAISTPGSGGSGASLLIAANGDSGTAGTSSSSGVGGSSMFGSGGVNGGTAVGIGGGGYGGAYGDAVATKGGPGGGGIIIVEVMS